MLILIIPIETYERPSYRVVSTAPPINAGEHSSMILNKILFAVQYNNSMELVNHIYDFFLFGLLSHSIYDY